MERLHLKEIDWLKLLQTPKSWLLALTVALAGLHLTILDLSHQPNLMSVSILMWLAIASLLWEQRGKLSFKSDLFSTALGATLIVLVLLRSFSPAGYHLRISPLLCGIGLALMTSGSRRLLDYWKELSILSLLALYSVFANILQALDLPTLTAQFGNFSLLLGGFQSYRDGVFITLPTGKVEVYGACSGVESIILMFYVAYLFLLLIPISRLQQVVCLAVAVLLGFITNGVRVAIMAYLVAYSNKEAFDYWHGDDGSLIFAMISVGIFGIFCWFAYVRHFDPAANSEEL